MHFITLCVCDGCKVILLRPTTRDASNISHKYGNNSIFLDEAPEASSKGSMCYCFVARQVLIRICTKLIVITSQR